ncbi:hypothetical protein KKE92_03020 [Candidatus Micrarchaeota archaeon]|nr:hypothetical protein [Candidatus Micrarchaeota archaeon]MBU1682211.1 hypothetical protein [Candidatus Micrarchaeota archaeon]
MVTNGSRRMDVKDGRSRSKTIAKAISAVVMIEAIMTGAACSKDFASFGGGGTAGTTSVGGQAGSAGFGGEGAHAGEGGVGGQGGVAGFGGEGAHAGAAGFGGAGGETNCPTAFNDSILSQDINLNVATPVGGYDFTYTGESGTGAIINIDCASNNAVVGTYDCALYNVTTIAAPDKQIDVEVHSVSASKTRVSITVY